MKRKLREILFLFGVFSVSALLLTVIQVPFGFGWLAWVGLIPFILVCRPQANAWRLMWVSFIVWACYWLGNLYWIGIVTIPGYVLLSLSLGLYWPVLALCVRYCRRKQWPLFLAAAVLFVGAEAWQGVLYTGFSWLLLGHSQYANTALIQIADIFGALGVSFVVAMVNGLAAELIIDAKKRELLRVVNVLKFCIVAIIVSGAVFYGRWRIGQTQRFVRAGPLVGSVQPNVPSNVKESAEAGDAIVSALLERSDACMQAGAKLVAWPETMVPATLNGDYLVLCEPDSPGRKYDRLIRQHVKDKGYVLVGAHAVNIGLMGLDYVVTDRFNSAFLYRPDGQQDTKRYDKIHLIPFGEFIPFKTSAPFIYNLVIHLSPYDYDYNLTHGREYTIFEMADGGETFRFGVLICYEDTDAEVTRRMVLGDDGVKKADWLVNISNDGWYVMHENSRVLPSVELSQRLAISVFRAVENRVSIFRSVNTGISCVIDSAGRIRDGFISGDLPKDAMARQGVEGWFVDRIQIDSRITLFNKHGQWLDFLLTKLHIPKIFTCITDFICAIGLIVVIILASRDVMKRRKSMKIEREV